MAKFDKFESIVFMAYFSTTWEVLRCTIDVPVTRGYGWNMILYMSVRDTSEKIWKI